MKNIETVVIGGGQAGLATSYYLTQHGHEHIILEQADRIANAWRERSWDSLTLVTPNSAFRMPGNEHGIDHPSGFMPLDDIILFFEDYVKKFNLPVVYNTKVLSVAGHADGTYMLKTNGEVYVAKNVVIATGFYQNPKIPSVANNLSIAIKQMHSSAYRRPSSVPEGAVLVVGSGQSGGQIAEELLQAGRKVFLCVGTAGRAPRRYRGKDIIEWLNIVGLFDLTPEQLPPGMGKFDGIPHLTGAQGGHTINLHQFAKDGITLLGHLRFAENDKVMLATDLHNSLQVVDGFEKDVTQAIDEYIRSNSLDIPAEALPQLEHGYHQPLLEELDLSKEGINTIIWATGYTFDYSMVKLSVLDGDGFPIQSHGVTKFPGLYFVGMPWMPSEKSGFLLGVGESARHIAAEIVMQPDFKSQDA
jgi:putative flavoprotein involved in K+ transport